MKATIEIIKSFDKAKVFAKEPEDGDMQEFFNDEGEYLDRLTEMLSEKGESGDEFTVVYTVTVVK